MIADYMPHNRPTDRNFKDGINDKFNSTVWEDQDYGVPMGSATNKPQDHPRFKGEGEREKAFRNGKSRPSRRLPDGTQSYKTPDGAPSKHIRPS